MARSSLRPFKKLGGRHATHQAAFPGSQPGRREARSEPRIRTVGTGSFERRLDSVSPCRTMARGLSGELAGFAAGSLGGSGRRLDLMALTYSSTMLGVFSMRPHVKW